MKFVTKQVGFTLIELMIVLVVISILASIAVPAYQDSVQKSRRADAKAALSAAASQQEKWMFQYNGYSDDIDDIGGSRSPEGYYTVSVSVNAGVGTCADDAPYSCYTLTATATGAQAEDTDCRTFTLTHTGVRAATGDDTSRCW